MMHAAELRAPPRLQSRLQAAASSAAATSIGIVRVCHSPTSYDECTLSALSASHHNPGIPQTQYFVDGCEQGRSSIFSRGALERVVNTSVRMPKIYRWNAKLLTWLRSPYAVTLGLDCDVTLLHGSLLENVWTALGVHGSNDLARAYDWPQWMQRLVPPMPCAGLVAWRNSSRVSRYFRAALRAYRNGSAPAAWSKWHYKARPGVNIRWSDQEALYYAFSGEHAANLKQLILPESYLCPLQWPSLASPPPRAVSAALPAKGGPGCLAVHAHTRRKCGGAPRKSVDNCAERERDDLQRLRSGLPYTKGWLVE